MRFAGNRRFELRRELGRGGMGVVYEAFDTERQQPVALKMLHRNDPETIVLLKQEFRSLSEIVHPRLISMYELLGDEQHWFFTMEFVRDGRNFLDSLHAQMGMVESAPAPSALPDSSSSDAPTRSPASDAATAHQAPSDAATLAPSPSSSDEPTQMPSSSESVDPSRATVMDQASEARSAPRVIHLARARRTLRADQVRPVLAAFRQLAEGVMALHAQGKLHRDLKPGNVIVRGDGSVVILDFGLAIAKARATATPPASGDAGRTSGSSSKGQISGTIAYMAPEQAAGLPLTEASDWYAVGTMLFEALTGELPFRGRSGEMLIAKQSQDAPDVNTLVGGLAPELAALCNGLLERDPALRPPALQILQILGGAAAAIPQAAVAEDQAAFIGRAEYLQRLDASFKRSRSHAVVAHLRGRSGTGKSALMAEFARRVAERHNALVFRSRCYEQESVPYKTMDGLADEVAHWLAQQSPLEQRDYRPAAAHSLTQIFPVFGQVPAIAAAPARPTTDLAELRRLSFAALAELLRRIGEAHPLVLCIDDLQWGDADGVEMLAVALSQPSIRLQLIVTFREEYVESSPCLSALLAFEGRTRSLAVEDIAVQPLNREESLELARHRNPEAPLQDLEEMVRQAEGNPYFLEELAYHSGPARPDSAGLRLDAILWSRIARLAPSEIRLLETVAVSGQPIRLIYAQKAAGLDDVPVSMLTSLRMHHLLRSSGSGLRDQVETYHDRIRETVLANLSRDARRNRHANLAACLEASGEATSDTLAVHFEAGGEPQKAGQFYELAAQESAKALAFSRAEEFYNKARQLAADPATRTRITERLIHLNTDLARFPRAYALGRDALAGLGLKIPAKFFPPGFLADLARFWILFRGRKIESILDLPGASDLQHIGRIALLAAIGKAAYQIRPELCIAIMLKIVNDSVRLGNSRDSAIGYMAVGSIFLGGILGRYPAGYEFGQASLQLVERYHADRIRAEVNFVVGYFGTSWCRPSQQAEQLWQVAHQAGLETGDLFHMGCACCATVMSQFMRGVPFDQLEPIAEEYLELLTRFGLREPRSAVLAVCRMIERLKNPAPEVSGAVKSTHAGESEPEFGSRHFAHYAVLLRMQEQVLLGEYEAAIATGRQSAQFLSDSRGMLHSTEHYFWLALAHLAILRSRSPVARLVALRRLRRDMKRFDRWATHSPANFRARALVLRGAYEAVTGKSESAMASLTEAAETALGYNQPHIAGMATQMVAAELARQSETTRHKQLIAGACDHYRRWGAHGLAARLADAPNHELAARSPSA
ncbi:MAG TPA: protein kinase [Acidobacteriaceae bacterium]